MAELNLDDLITVSKKSDENAENKEPTLSRLLTQEEMAKEAVSKMQVGVVETASAKQEIKPQSKIISHNDIPTASEKELSPLEKMKQYKENHSGTIVNKEDVTYDNDPKVFKNSVENDRREDEFKDYLRDMDSLIDAARDVKLARPITGPIEEAIAIDQLDRIAREKRGAKVEAPKLKDGSKAVLSKEDMEGSDLKVNGEKVSFVVEKTEEDKKAETKETEKASESQEGETEKTPEEIETEKKAKEEEEAHDKLVNVLIDKTGYGVSEINFTEEEKKKLETATTIRVTEVENIDLDSIVFEAPDKTFVENMSEGEENSFGASSVPLVASRYRVKMKGLGYGQLGDLMINQQAPTFEQYHKQYSIIYNSIASTSIGKFESFEDFLKNTAMIDIEMMLYGLVLATYPEVDSVGIRCGECNNTYEQKYFVREILDLKHANTKYLNKLNELMDCEPSKFVEYHNESPIFKRKMIRLPHSGNLIEFGLASAYDYLYQILHNVLDPNFAEKYADDVNGMMQLNIMFLNMIRAVGVKTGTNKDGKPVYTKYDTFDDIIQVLYRLPPEDLQIMTSVLNQYTEAYTVNFSLRQSKCPKCGRVQEYTPMPIDRILFFKFQLLMSTDVEVTNMLDL